MIYGSVLKVTREDRVEDIGKIFDKMKGCGFNTVVIWPSCFWWEEKSPEYPFKTGKEILRMAEKKEIKVIMELAGQLHAMEYMPDFKMKDEYYATDRDGHIIRHQSSFGFINYFHPEVDEIICDHYRKTAEAYKDFDALLAYDVFNETMFESFDKYTVAKFQEWLKNKYKTIDKLNQVWERTYSAFDQIEYTNWMWMSIAPVTDYEAFKKDSVPCFIKRWCDAIKSVDDQHFTIADNIYSSASPKSLYGRPHDDFALKEAVDEIGMSFYPKQPQGSFDKILRWNIFDGLFAASKRQGYYISEMQTHIQAFFNPTTAVRPSELKMWSFEALASGAKGIIYWMWRPFTKGLQTMGRGIVDYKGRETERYEAVREIGETYQSMGDVRPVRSLVGVVYDKDCDDYQRAYTRAYQVDKDIYVQSVNGAFGAMLDNNIHADIITFDEISEYKAVILTNHIALGEEDAEKLSQYVEKGGILIIDGKFGMVNKETMLNKDLPGGCFNSQIGMDYLDSNYVDMDFEYAGKPVAGYYFKYICDVKSGAVSARFNDGRCAVLTNKVGKGTVVTINTDIWYGYAKTRDERIKDFAKTIAEQYQFVSVKTDKDVFIRLCENESEYVAFVFNYSDAKQTGQAEFKKQFVMEFDVDPFDVQIMKRKKNAV